MSPGSNDVAQQIRSILSEASRRFTQKEVAARMGVSLRTISRWIAGETTPPVYASDALLQRLELVEVPLEARGSFTFADLFAGIGGTRLGFEAHGGKCVFTSEWDKFAQKTYATNFKADPYHEYAGDITAVDVNAIPDHDVLIGGFPCQPFSLAGVSKKNSLGHPHGFENATQGTLFFNIAKIIAAKRPRAFMLENVKNLLSHDRGKTFTIIIDTLREEFGYDVHYKVINANHFVPQNRERIFIVGFREPTPFDWGDLVLPEAKPVLSSILHPQDGSEEPEDPFTIGEQALVNEKYTLSPRLWQYLQDYAAKHRAAGNGFGFGLVTPQDRARTLSARYHKDGSEILIDQPDGSSPRRLTPRECARLMGFRDTYQIPVSDTQAYRQFGNSVAVPVIKEIARIMIPHLNGKH